MTTTSQQLFPPGRGVVVGQLVPRVRRPRWPLHILAGLIVLSVGLSIFYGILSVSTGVTPEDAEFLLFEAIFIIFLSASLGDAYCATRRSSFVIRLRFDGVEVHVRKHSYVIPWSRVKRLLVIRSGSTAPVLCAKASELPQFAAQRLHLRIKGRANQQLFGTPLATPLLGTGLTEAACLDATRLYVESYRTLAGRPDTVVDTTSYEDLHEFPFHHRFRRRLAALLITVGSVFVATVWLVAVGLARLQTAPQGTAPAEAEDALRVVASVAISVAATLAIVRTATSAYHAIVPLGNVAKRFAEPIVRVGSEGVEHLVRGRLAQVPWDAVRSVYLISDRSGAQHICVITADPSALVPQTRHSRTKAKQNERRYGTPVVVPMAGSGLAAEDLLNAVRHYSADRVPVGEPLPPRPV